MENLEFLPERIRLQRARRRRILRQMYLCGLCVVALVALGYVRQGAIRKAQAEVNVLKDRCGEVQRQLSLRSELERQQAELLIMKRIDEQLGSRINAVDVMAELDKILPRNMTLSNLNLDVVEIRKPIEGLGSRRATTAGDKKMQVEKRVRLTLTGLAPSDVDVANFIGQLSGSPLFEDINMGYAKNVEINGRVAREFQASCNVVR